MKRLQTNNRDIFKGSFSEGNWERKGSELRRETVLWRLEVLCREGSAIGSLTILRFPMWRVNWHAQLSAYGNSLLIPLWSVCFCFFFFF